MRRFQFIMIPAGVLSLLFGMMFRVGIAPARAQIRADGVFDETMYGDAPVLQRGVRGTAVQDLQIFLERTDYYSGPIDGIYDSQVERAVMDYQMDFDLPRNGMVDDRTWDVMSTFNEQPDRGLYEEEREFDRENREFYREDTDNFDRGRM